jgi:hypothetical protein
MYFLWRGVVSTSPNAQAGGPPLVGYPRLLIQFIHSYPPCRRPFLHPQPEDAPCRGDRNPHSWKQDTLYSLIYYSKSALHVSGNLCPHHQEYWSVFTVSGSVHLRCCRLVSRMSCCSFNSFAQLSFIPTAFHTYTYLLTYSMEQSPS